MSRENKREEIIRRWIESKILKRKLRGIENWKVKEENEKVEKKWR